MINGAIQPDTLLEALLYDIQCLQKQLRLIKIIFAPRECNNAAHVVAFFDLIRTIILITKQGTAFEGWWPS